MKTPTMRRTAAYLAGVILGCLILALIPRTSKKNHLPEFERTKAPYGYYPVEWTDAYGRQITIKSQPWRIASMAPSVTEIIFALGAGDRLIADTTWCRYPEEANDRIKIGNLDSPNREVLVQLQPQLVLGSTLTPEMVYRQLSGSGLTAMAFRHDSLETVIQDIKDIGRILGIPGAALKEVLLLENQKDALIGAIAEKSRGIPNAVVLYDLEGLFSAGQGSWPGDMIELCRARNIAASAPSAWPKLSLESLIKAKPDVILVATSPRREGKVKNQIEKLKSRSPWRDFPAVRDGRVHIINADWLNIPGPRMIKALSAFAHALHPEAFPGIEYSPEPNGSGEG